MGVVIAVAILVLFPLAAVGAARLWRDPPPEKWGISAKQRAAAANDPQLVAYQLRSRLGVLDDRLWRQAHRAIRRGEAAPPELRVATHELAERRIVGLDRRLARSRRVFPLLVSSLGVAAVAVVYLLLHHVGLSLIYLALWVVRVFAESPWLLRRVRSRAEAAVAANA